MNAQRKPQPVARERAMPPLGYTMPQDVLAIEGDGYIVTGPKSLHALRQIISDRIEVAGALRVDVRSWSPAKTRRQENYFHACCAEWATQLRVDPEDLKQDLKEQFGVVTVRISLATGEREAFVKSTTRYTQDEYTGFIHACIAWAANYRDSANARFRLHTSAPLDHETAERLARMPMAGGGA